MKTRYSLKYNTKTTTQICLFLCFFLQIPSITAQEILFDFDNASLHSPLPVSQTVNGITATFTATGQGYSIQEANVLGFTPQGFSGRCIYPNSIYLADLMVQFDQTITDFSIMYSPQELGCDDSATMQVTAYMNSNLVGTNTKTANNPGTWPTDILNCSFPQGFNNVVIHYNNKPPTCQDYGVIFMADNMRVSIPTAGLNQSSNTQHLFISNPISERATISFSLTETENINIVVYDLSGRLVKTLFIGYLNSGDHQIIWDTNETALKEGIYILNIKGDTFSQSDKIIIAK